MNVLILHIKKLKWVSLGWYQGVTKTVLLQMLQGRIHFLAFSSF